jgi:hypothetical protein
MIAYNNIEMLQDQLPTIIKQFTVSATKFICVINFYRKNFDYAFNA